MLVENWSISEKIKIYIFKKQKQKASEDETKQLFNSLPSKPNFPDDGG